MYAEWKVVLWRFVRVFLAAFLTQLLIIFPTLEKFPPLDDVYPMLLLPALTAGIVALFKYLRDKFAAEDYTKLIHKLPL